MSWLIVGLGNPGPQYERTQHNLGFLVVDRIAERNSIRVTRQDSKALIGVGVIAGQNVILAKPQTFMNLSGRSLRQVVDFYQVDLKDLLVVCDDVNLPLGQLRIRARGSHGGHNGLRDVQNHLGTQEYSRLRIGVGAAEGRALEGAKECCLGAA